MIDQTIFEPKQLLVQPLQRVGYSDRTAWLMAAMSELAYLEFEDANWCGLDVWWSGTGSRVPGRWARVLPFLAARE